MCIYVCIYIYLYITSTYNQHMVGQEQNRGCDLRQAVPETQAKSKAAASIPHKT